MKKAAFMVLGIILIITSVPGGFIINLAANGCCGAPSRGGFLRQVSGGIFMISMIEIGTITVAYGKSKGKSS